MAMDCTRTSSTSVDQHWPISRHWLVRFTGETNNQPAASINSRCTTDSLAAFSVAVLLGPAGIGKSHEGGLLADAELQAGRDVRTLNLGEYASSRERLRAKLEDLSEGITNDTSFFLDGLDEARQRCRGAWIELREWFEETRKKADARLRIMCRSAEWPADLREALTANVGSDSYAEAHLLELDDEGIAAAANTVGIDADAFLRASNQRRAGPLASHPMTLKMMLRIFAASGDLPSTRKGLFETGVQILAESSHERFERGTTPSQTVNELLNAAARLACYSVLTGKQHIDCSDGNTAGAIGHLELSALDDGGLCWDRNLLQAVGTTGLCTADSAGVISFAHRQMAEFLAGRRIASLPFHQARAMLASSAGWQVGVAGPLRETAAFAAMYSEDIARWISETDPEIVGLSDVADDALRKRAMNGLFDLCRTGRVVDSTLPRDQVVLEGFRHIAAETDLRAFLAERKNGVEDVLALAIDMTEAWKLTGLSDALADLVLDPTAPFQSRVSAGYALCKVGIESEKSRLKRLVGDPEDDEVDQLKGIAIRCCWPKHLTEGELLAALRRPKRTSFHGAYAGVLWELDKAEFAAETDIVSGLKWATENITGEGETNSLDNIAYRIVHRALCRLDEEGVSQALVDLLHSPKLRHIRSPLTPRPRPSWYDDREDTDPLPSPFEVDDRRRAVINLIVKSRLKKTVLWHLAFETPGLVNAADIEWLFAKIESPDEPADAKLGYAHFLHLLIREWQFDTSHFARWLGLKDEALRTAVWSIPPSVDLESDEAQQSREWWEQDRSPTITEPAQLDPPPSERVRECIEWIEQSEGVSVGTWTRLCQELSLEPDSTHYWFSDVISDTPGWQEASEADRARILGIAKGLLESESDEAVKSRDLELNQLRPACLAAMLLVSQEAEDWFEARPAKWWTLWAHYIVRHCSGGNDENELVLKRTMLGLLHQHVPEETAERVIHFASDDDPQAGFIVDASMEAAQASEHREVFAKLLEAVKSGVIASPSRQSVMSAVLKTIPEVAIDFLESKVNGLSDTHDDPAALDAAVVLLATRPHESWPTIASFLDRCPIKAKSAVGRAADGLRYRNPDSDAPTPLLSLKPSQMEEFLAQLFVIVPPKDDPQRDGVYSPGPDDRAREVRDWLLRQLGDMDSEEATEALRRVEKRFGDEYPWLRRPRARAERALRQSQWEPMSLTEIAAVLRSDDQRLIRSEADLLDGIVCALQDYERQLRLPGIHSPTDLWNESSTAQPTPKHEEDASNKIAGVIQAYFKDFTVVTGRELQVRRRVIKKEDGGEPGSKLDVSLEVPGAGADDGEAIRVVIEVKFSHNREVKTALESQLVERYLPQIGTSSGIYVVVWMSVSNPKQLDTSHRPKWSSIEDARKFLETQAKDVSSRKGVDVRAVVIDASLL